MLGSTANTLKRTRLAAAQKQQWPDHGLMACGGVRGRDRDTKPRACLQGEVDECSDAESHGASLENSWIETETGDAWDHSTCGAAAVWENEDEYPEESCVDEAAEEASKLAENRL